jgi:hypothetical protein
VANSPGEILPDSADTPSPSLGEILSADETQPQAGPSQTVAHEVVVSDTLTWLNEFWSRSTPSDLVLSGLTRLQREILGSRAASGPIRGIVGRLVFRVGPPHWINFEQLADTEEARERRESSGWRLVPEHGTRAQQLRRQHTRLQRLVRLVVNEQVERGWLTRRDQDLYLSEAALAGVLPEAPQTRELVRTKTAEHGPAAPEPLSEAQAADGHGLNSREVVEIRLDKRSGERSTLWVGGDRHPLGKCQFKLARSAIMRQQARGVKATLTPEGVGISRGSLNGAWKRLIEGDIRTSKGTPVFVGSATSARVNPLLEISLTNP